MKIDDLQSIFDEVYMEAKSSEEAGSTQLPGEVIDETFVEGSNSDVNALIQHLQHEYTQIKEILDSKANSYMKYSYDTLAEAKAPIHMHKYNCSRVKGESDYIRFRLEQMIAERTGDEFDIDGL